MTALVLLSALCLVLAVALALLAISAGRARRERDHWKEQAQSNALRAQFADAWQAAYQRATERAQAGTYSTRSRVSMEREGYVSEYCTLDELVPWVVE